MPARCIAYSLLSNGGVPNSDLDGWLQGRSLADLHAAYRFNGFRLDAALSNMFDSRSYRATVGRKDVGIGTMVDSGRTASLKLSYIY